MTTSNELLNNFLDSTVEAAELNTEYFLCPEFDEVPATLKDYTVNSGTRKDPSGEEEKPWFSVQFKYEIDSVEAREAVHRDECIVSGRTIFLNLDSSGRLDPVANQTLARMTKIFDIDISGLSLRAILESFKGRQVTARVIHRALTDRQGAPLLDEEGKQRYVAEVSNIGPA